MSNEELMRRLASGDESALEELTERNMGLICGRARLIAREYGCEGQKETLSELEGEGMVAFFECIRSGKYDESKGKLTTYVVPFIDGAIRRYAKRELRFAGAITEDEIESAEELSEQEDESVSVEETVHRAMETEEMRRNFESLPKRDRDILGKCFGVFGYQKEALRDIAMYHMVSEDAVEKAKRRAQDKLLGQINAAEDGN